MIVEHSYKTITDPHSFRQIPSNLPIEECRADRSIDYINWIRDLDKLYPAEIHGDDIPDPIFCADIDKYKLGTFPRFVIARCHMGDSFDIHLIGFCNGFHISHIKKEEILPHLLQNARVLAKNYNYKFVEVYEDKMLLIRQ